MILCTKSAFRQRLNIISNRMMTTSNTTIAVCQLTATSDKKQNLQTVKKLVAQAAEKAVCVFLPEGCDYVANNETDSKSLAESLDGQLMSEYKLLALKHKIWLSIGGFHELQQSNGTESLRNAHVLIDAQGDIAAVYRKMHLFDVTLPEKNINLKESRYISKGTEIVAPVTTPIGSLGLMICYDLRFPELSIILRKMGANLLTFPSAFTVATGEAHWKTLLQARAIENQCYVVAAAQYGVHNTKRTSFGNSLIINPWGEVVAECPQYSKASATNESVAFATVNEDLLRTVRSEMPVFTHRRDDIYKLISLSNITDKINAYMFSDKVIPPSTVFYTTPHSFAFTNIRCVVPGHVLVASLRKVERLEGLSPEEVADLFQTVIKIQKLVEVVYGSCSSTICVQDGPEAGQTVPHVHCHILPRKSGDFPQNDDIYLELAKHDKNDANKPVRSLEEMSAEANMLKSYL